MAKEARYDPKNHLTFKEFVELALYGPLGYFSSGKHEIGGETGHFTTAVEEYQRKFGEVIARHIYDFWQRLGKPERFHVIELGSGKGTLARNVLDTIRSNPEMENLYRAINYIACDASEKNIRKHPKMKKLTSILGDALGLDLHVDKGVVISNELIDNLPPHKVVAFPDGRLKAAVLELNLRPETIERLKDYGIKVRNNKGRISKNEFIRINRAVSKLEGEKKKGQMNCWQMV